MSAAEGEALSLLSQDNPFRGNCISPSLVYPLDNYLNVFASAGHGCVAPAMQAQPLKHNQCRMPRTYFLPLVVSRTQEAQNGCRMNEFSRVP